MPSPAPQNEPLLEDGDLGFTGLNELTQPSQLEPGDVAAASNARFTNNKAEPRLGVAKLAWTNQVGAGSATPLPFGTIYGGIDFRDPSGLDWTIIAADGKVWRTRDSNGAVSVPLPAAVVINAPVTFTQCFSGLVMFRGEALPELIMADVDTGFAVVDQADNLISGADTENPTDGLEAIPFAANGDWVGNRLFIPYSKDLLAISDYMNPTRYQGIRSQARINQGSEDALVRFFKFSDDTGIAFKDQSVYVLNGLTGDLSGMALDSVTEDYGCAAPKSCVNTGADVWFLSERRGICSIYQTELNKIQGKDVPVSQRIKKLIDRINWKYAAGAVAAYYDNKYYLAVPLDDAVAAGPELVNGSFGDSGPLQFQLAVVPGQNYRVVLAAGETIANGGVLGNEGGDLTAVSTKLTLQGPSGLPVQTSIRRIRPGVNNAVLVYDFLQQKWAGADTGGAICVQEWIKGTYQGARRLFALSADGYVNLYEEMPYDEVGLDTFGTNIANGNYGVGGTVTLAVTPGRTYLYAQANHDTSITNGTQGIVNVSGTETGTFLSQGNTILLTGIVFQNVTATIQLLGTTIGVEWIAQDTTLRGFTCQTVGRKRFIRCALELETWCPEFSVYAITEGAVEQVAIVSDRTKSFVKYDRPWDKADWNRTNANDDHATKFRQDYALLLGDDTTASGNIAAGVVYFAEDLTGAASLRYNGVTLNLPATFTGVAGVTDYSVLSGTPQVYAPGNYFIPGLNGINPDQTQESTEKLRFPLQCRGKQVQLRIVTTRGRVSVLSAAVEGVLSDKAMGSQV